MKERLRTQETDLLGSYACAQELCLPANRAESDVYCCRNNVDGSVVCGGDGCS